MDCRAIYPVVGLVAFDIFVCILATGYADNDEEGEDYEAGRNGRELVEELKNRYTQEEARVAVNQTERDGWTQHTHTLATRRNCSSRLRGKKVMTVYLEVIT